MNVQLSRRGKKGIWTMTWNQPRPEGGYRKVFRTTKTSDRTVAEAVRALIQQALDGTLVQQAAAEALAALGSAAGPTEVKLCDVAEFFVRHAEQTESDRQRRDKLNELAGFVGWMQSVHPEVTTVRQVTVRIAHEWWSWTRDEGFAPRSRNRKLSSLSAVWKAMASAAELEVIPWDRIRRDRRGGQRLEALTPDQVRDLFAAAVEFGRTQSRMEEGFWPAAVLMGFYTGLRESDIAQLEAQEVRREDDLLLLTPNKTRKWGPKAQVAHGLDAPWAEWLPECETGPFWPEADRVCRTAQKLLSEEFMAICEAAGIEVERERKADEPGKQKVKLVTFHSLRHAFVTAAMLGGADQRDVQSLAGHSSARMTGHYDHSRAAAAARRVASVMPDVTKETGEQE